MTGERSEYVDRKKYSAVSPLCNGLKFAITQKIQPLDISAPIEAALQYSVAPPQEVEMARIQICEAIKRAKPSRRNWIRAEWRAVRALCKDDTVCILQSDKGNATVILDTEDYDSKVQDLLNDRQSYIILKKYPPKLWKEMY